MAKQTGRVPTIRDGQAVYDDEDRRALEHRLAVLMERDDDARREFVGLLGQVKKLRARIKTCRWDISNALQALRRHREKRSNDGQTQRPGGA